MSKSEITERLGQFGEINYNGRFYPSTLHAYFTEIIGNEVLLTRPDRSQITIKIASIKKFTRKKVPE